MDFEDIPKNYQKIIAKGCKVVIANAQELLGIEVQEDQKQYLNVPNWQKRAIERIIGPNLKKIKDIQMSEKLENPEKEIGFLMGMIDTSLSLSDSKLLPDEIKDLAMPIPKENDDGINHGKIVKIAEEQPAEWKTNYYEGYSDGLKKSLVNPDGEFRIQSDATELYWTMLIFADQLHFCESWADIHEFVSEAVPEYKTKPDAMRKALERIGFSPNPLKK